MLDINQLSARIQALKRQDIGFEAFEDWFRSESRDASPGSVEIVFAVEDVLSQYHFEGLRGSRLYEELVAAIRPFLPIYTIYAENRVSVGTSENRDFGKGQSNADVAALLSSVANPVAALGL